MSDASVTTNGSVVVVPAAIERQSTVANLLELYAHDFSEYIDLAIGDNGRFGYGYLSTYWSNAGRHPFLIERDGKLAGVILVQHGSRITGDPDVWDMAEFFVLRGHRRHGVGAAAACEIWKRFEGKWEVRVTSKNPPALAFWGRTVSNYANQAVQPTMYDEDGIVWNLFSFESRSAA